MSQHSFRFRKTEHLRSPLDFRRVYDRKCSARDGCMTLFAAANDLPFSRLGLSVSRKVGGAVVRNRWRRLLREAFRLTKHDLPKGLDVILIPRIGTTAALGELKTSIKKLMANLARKLQKP